MMKRVAGVVIAAIVIFAWGAVSWTVLQWHNPPKGAMKGEAAIASALSANLAERGVYYLPAMPEHGPTVSPAEAQAMNDAWTARHRAGPLAMIAFHPDGREPVAPTTFAYGFAIDLAGALLAFLLLRSSKCGSFVARVAFVTILGAFVGVMADISYANWLFMPLDWSVRMALDHVVAWFLASLPLAWAAGGK